MLKNRAERIYNRSMIDEIVLRNYARLAVLNGVNLQKGQVLVISCDVNDAPFARLVTDIAYDIGAKEVIVIWRDEHITRTMYLRAHDSVFEEFPDWIPERFKYYDEREAAYLSIMSDDPDLLSDVNPERLRKLNILSQKACKEHKELLVSSRIRWSIIALPSVKWAKKVFPNLDETQAYNKLWTAIAKSSRIDCEDPIEAWRKHNEAFTNRAKILNEGQFEALHFKNSIGTDITIKLAENHVWVGCGNADHKGVYFYPNIPTEEIFTLPHKNGANGKVVSSMPLVYQMNTIEGIEIEFKDGEVTAYKASKNEELLKDIIETDEGSRRLGEVALVPYTSPISDMKILFYKTLFDENASCHLALGKGYSACIKGYEKMSKEEISGCGCNDSLTHVDFMFGTNDLKVTGVKKNGEEIVIFSDGNYTF